MMKLMILLVSLGMGMEKAIMGPKLGFPRLSDDTNGFSHDAKALLLVLFSFEGWENANTVGLPHVACVPS